MSIRNDDSWLAIMLVAISFMIILIVSVFTHDFPENVFLTTASIIVGIGYIYFLKSFTLTQDNKIGSISLSLLLGYFMIFIIDEFHFQIKTSEVIRYTGSSLIENLQWSLSIAFLRAGIPEEIFKFSLFLLVYYMLERNADQLEIIVLTTSVSMGYAITENISYITNAVIALNTDRYSTVFYYGDPSLIFIRFVTAYFMHFGMGIMMGYYFSKYTNQSSENTGNQGNNKYLFLSLLIPILIHGTYNTIVFAMDNEDVGVNQVRLIAFIIASSFLYYCLKLIEKLKPEKLARLQKQIKETESEKIEIRKVKLANSDS